MREEVCVREALALDLLRERVDSSVVRIGLRVVAAWIAAIAVLMLALVLSPPEG